MDFTYIIAGGVGLLTGLALGTVLAACRLTAKQVWLGVFIPATLTDAVLLIRWPSVGGLSPLFLILDFAAIAIFSLAGCSVGVLPALALRHILRYRKEKQARRGGSNYAA